jgi:hypothetical protein
MDANVCDKNHNPTNCYLTVTTNITTAEKLIHLDSVLPNDFDRLIALWRRALPTFNKPRGRDTHS